MSQSNLNQIIDETRRIATMIANKWRANVNIGQLKISDSQARVRDTSVGSEK